MTNIVESIIDAEKLKQTTSPIENTSIQQMALMAVKLLSKHLAERHPEQFKHIVEVLIDILRKQEKVPRILLATSVLCLSEICSNLRVRSIKYLPSFMKLFLEILRLQSFSQNDLSDNILISLITAMQKIVSTLANYLSPYLVEMIVCLARVWENIEGYTTKDAKRVEPIVGKLKDIWEKLSDSLELRILLPTINKSYEQIISDEQGVGIGPLMQLLTGTFRQNESSSISPFLNDITSFFIVALQFRCNNSNTDLMYVNKMEDKIIKSFATLTLKLSEGNFRPLYYRIYDWAFKQTDENLDRTITYFRLSCEIAQPLKILFVLFASDFIDDAANLLNESIEMSTSNEIKREKLQLLLESILNTLNFVFLHDNRGFIDATRFEMLLQPLVDQIEHEIVLESPKLMDLLSSTIAQFGTAANDDIRWKQLNYQILMKTRDNESHIRLVQL